MQENQGYKAWFEKYRPRDIGGVVFPNQDIEDTIKLYYDNGFITGNVLSYGPPGFGKTTISEVLIHKIIQERNDLFILGRKTEDVENLIRWLQQRPAGSKQKIVKIEEMDRLSYKAQIILKDGLMEKYQHNTAFLATTNNPQKIDSALLTRFNTRINFGELPLEKIKKRLAMIFNQEKISFSHDDLDKFVSEYHQRGLRDLINNIELASKDGTFDPTILHSFIGISGNEDLISQYIVYLIQYLETLDISKINAIIKDPKSDDQFFTYYDYMLKIFKNELRLNFNAIYDTLSNSALDFSAKNIVTKYWQELELKRFQNMHTISLMHDLTMNVREQKGL